MQLCGRGFKPLVARFSTKYSSLTHSPSKISSSISPSPKGFEIVACLKEMTNIGILEHKIIPKEKGKPESYYRPSKKYKFEPLKFFYGDLLEECSVHNTYQFRNSTLFSQSVPSKDLSDSERTILESSMQNIIRSYSSINLLFRRVGLRMANEIWKKRLYSVNISSPTKLYLWLKIIGIHYLATLDYAKKYDCYQNGVIPHVDIDIISIMKNRKFEPPFHLSYHTKEGILCEWQLNFFKMLDSAFYKYLKLKKIPFKKKKINEELCGLNFEKILEDTLLIRAYAEIFLIVNHPEFLPFVESKESRGIISGEIFDVWEASTFGYKCEEKLVEPKKQKPKPTFFDRNEFFSGIVNDGLIDINVKSNPDDVIERYRYEKEQDFYNELRMLANTFEVPRL